MDALLKHSMKERAQCHLSEAELAASKAVEEARRHPANGQIAVSLREHSAVKEAQGLLSEARVLLSASITSDVPRDAAGARQKRDRMLALSRLAALEGNIEDAIAIHNEALAFEATWHIADIRTSSKLAALLFQAGKGSSALAVYEQYGIVEYALPMKPGATSAQLSPPDFLDAASLPERRPPRACVPQASGKPPVNNVANVVAGMRAGFRNCFNAALAKNGSLSVGLWLTGKIDASGSVSRAWTTVHRSVPGELVTCQLEVLRATRFDPPEGGSATVVIPVTLVQPK